MLTKEEKWAEIKELVYSVGSVDYPEDIYDYSGGNFDDAFNLGEEYGYAAAMEAIRDIIEGKS